MKPSTLEVLKAALPTVIVVSLIIWGFAYNPSISAICVPYNDHQAGACEIKLILTLDNTNKEQTNDHRNQN